MKPFLLLSMPAKAGFLYILETKKPAQKCAQAGKTERTGEQTAIRLFTFFQDAADKAACPFFAGIGEEFLGRCMFNDFALVHKEDIV